MLLDQGENLATERMREKVKAVISEKLNTHAESEKWEECLNVPEELVQRLLSGQPLGPTR